jgi:hypothetical protein
MLLTSPSTGFGEESQKATIFLLDGSRLTGRILSSGDGKYLISVDSLGTLTVDQKQIESIQFKTEKSADPNVGDRSGSNRKITEEAVESAKQKILSDEEAMAKVMSLTNDPAFQALLNDPEIMGMVERGDFDGLMRHPKIQALSSNPVVRELSKEMD